MTSRAVQPGPSDRDRDIDDRTNEKTVFAHAHYYKLGLDYCGLVIITSFTHRPHNDINLPTCSLEPLDCAR